MARELNADELPIETGGSDPNEFNDELTSLAGSDGAPQNVRAVIEHEQEEQASELLEGLRSVQGAESIRWKVYRTNSDDPDRDGYLEQISTARLTPDYLRDTYGPGEYRIRGHYTNSGKYAAQRTITIAKGARRRETETDVKPSSGSAFDIQGFLAQQEARDERRRQAEEERADKRRQERLDLITALAPILAPVAANLLGNRGPDLTALVAALKPAPQPGMHDLIQALAALKQLEPQPVAPVPPETPIDQVLGIVEKLREFGFAEGEGKTSLWDIAKEFVKTAGPGIGQLAGAAAMAMQNRAGSAQAPMRAALPGAIPGSAVPLATLPAPVGMPLPSSPSSIANVPDAAGSPPSAPMVAASTVAASSAPNRDAHPSTIDPKKAQSMGLFDLLPLASHLPWLKGHIENLLVRAARGSNPELCAEWMLDDFPQGADPNVLGQLLARADWFSLVQQLDIRVTQFSDWFSDFRDSMLRMIQEDQQASMGQRVELGRTPAGMRAVEIRGPGDESDTSDTDPEMNGAEDEGEAS